MRSRKQGRVRTLRLVPGRLDEQRELWSRRLDQLDDYLQTLKGT